ncbi:methyl-accepting chemotaxis protein [Vibrio maritimus]|uniref:methyl-accepting chemotaxis protein n=1 Tax=Vibrio maritimus TaxID=990268 RepID=UPI003735EA89
MSFPKLSLIHKVIVGFVSVLACALIISISAFDSQKSMAAQFHFIEQTLGKYLDKSNSLANYMLETDRLVLVHANTRQTEDLRVIEKEVSNKIGQVNELTKNLLNDLQDYPMLQQQLRMSLVLIEEAFADAKTHIMIHQNRLSSERNLIESNDRLTKEWAFYARDIEDLRVASATSGYSNLMWPINILSKQGSELSGLLKRVNEARTLDQVLTHTQVLDGVFNKFKTEINKVTTEYQDSRSKLQPYLLVADYVVNAETGIVKAKQSIVSSDDESRRLLQTMNARMNQLLGELEQFNASIRSLTNSAILESNERTDASNRVNILLFVGTLLITGFIVRSVVVSIRTPLQAITSSLKAISEGDLTYRINEKYNSEMDLIATSINALGTKLQNLVTQIQEANNSVSKVVTHSMAMSSKTLEETNNQHLQTEMVSTSVHEMERVVEQTSMSIVASNKEVEDVMELAVANMTVTEKNVQFVTSLRSSLLDACEVINQLQQQSELIKNVVSVIQSISEQTNLLALNAAIEAARAGDQGKGFAVVADEVRTLAIRTNGSTEEINQIIGALESKSKLAVEMVEQNLQQAELSVKQSGDSRDSLNAIIEKLSVITENSRSITSASEEQMAAVQEVARSAAEISNVANNIANNSRDFVKENESLIALSSQQTKLIGQFNV